MKKIWTKEMCNEFSILYKTRREFSLKNWKVYDVSSKNGWLNEICLHMKNKPKNYWNKERCLEVALTCQSRNEFCKKHGSAYSKSVENKWLDDICKHMITNDKMIRNENGLVIPYWTKERCSEVALTCQTKKEFRQKYSSAYASSFENKWLNEICNHMKLCGNLYKRMIYLCEFSDNYVYIGLTCNLNKRKINHFKSGSVFEHILSSGLIPNFIILTDFLNIEKAVEMEKYYVDYYKKFGYEILNRTKTGSLGFYSNKIIKSKWNFETCKNESLKYSRRSLFAKYSQRAYKISRENEWLDEFYKLKRSKKIKINNSL